MKHIWRQHGNGIVALAIVAALLLEMYSQQADQWWLVAGGLFAIANFGVWIAMQRGRHD